MARRYIACVFFPIVYKPFAISITKFLPLQNETMTTSDTNLVLLERLKQLRFIREGSVRPSSSETTFIPKFSSEKFLPANILPVKIKPQPAAYSENFVTRLLSLMEKKRNCSSSNNDVDSSIFIFNPPDWKWQKNKASELDLPIEKIHYDSKVRFLICLCGLVGKAVGWWVENTGLDYSSKYTNNEKFYYES